MHLTAESERRKAAQRILATLSDNRAFAVKSSKNLGEDQDLSFPAYLVLLLNNTNMKHFISSELIDKLQADTRQIILTLNHLRREDPEVLVQQPAPNKWSVAQVLEHLNAYGRYYLPAMQSAMNDYKGKGNPQFKPGWLGDYFTKMIAPKENNRVTNKMQAPKGYRPSADIDSKDVLDEFSTQQQFLLELLETARTKDLKKIRVPISISKLIKLSLGDTFRFVIAHHQRHFVQVENTLAAVRRVSDLKFEI
jgi:hypothetical protein